MLNKLFAARIDRLKDELRKTGLDAYIVSTEENIWYLTNLVYREIFGTVLFILYLNKATEVIG
jgi:Xaa-Pro aminopeptidase